MINDDHKFDWDRDSQKDIDDGAARAAAEMFGLRLLDADAKNEHSFLDRLFFLVSHFFWLVFHGLAERACNRSLYSLGHGHDFWCCSGEAGCSGCSWFMLI